MIVHSALPPIASKVCKARSKACSSRAANAQPMESKMRNFACCNTSSGMDLESNSSIRSAICFTSGILARFDASFAAIIPQGLSFVPYLKVSALLYCLMEDLTHLGHQVGQDGIRYFVSL